MDKLKPGVPVAKPTLIIPLLLKDYFNVSEKFTASLAPNPQAFLLRIRLTPQASRLLFQSQIAKPSGEMLFQYEETIEFPQNLNAVLVNYVLKASQALGDEIKAKDLAPFLNQTSSADAYLSYAEGMTAFQNRDLVKAQKAFEGSIKNDYNYVPAYVGLSVVLKELSDSRAEAEWQKAQLLNPHLSKMMKERSFCP
jgi:tetratricopeptide (TPR) repeat protein